MSRFTEKIGGLPVWAWSLIIGLVFVAAMYWYRMRASSGTVQSSGVGASRATGTGALDSLVGGSGTLAGSGSGVGTTTPREPESAFTSNSTWLAQGVALLGGQGVAPLDAERSLTNYLTGGNLIPSEASWVNRVIASKGLAPQGTAGMSTVGTPAPAPIPDAPTVAAVPVDPTAEYNQRTGLKTTAQLAYDQAQYFATMGNTDAANQLRAVQYVSGDPATRSADDTSWFAARYLQDHGSAAIGK